MNMKSKKFLPLALIVSAVLIGGAYMYERAPLEQEAAWGKAESQYELARCYFYGIGVNQNYRQAAKWFNRAAHQGHARAEAALGMMYVQGFGVSQNYETAARLFQHAASQGLDAAQNQLGMLYAQGKGVDQNLDEASNWFQQAAEQGYAAARQNLKLLGATRPGFFTKVTTRSGNIYRQVKVQKVEWDGITVQFEPAEGGVGVAKLAFRELPVELQQQYGLTPGQQLANSGSAVQLAAIVVRPL